MRSIFSHLFYYLCAMNREVTIRPATIHDAELIAEVVCMAVGYTTEHPIYPVFLELAKRDIAQYSYRNTLIAEVAGRAAGALVGYDGARLEELRRPIFELLERHLGSIPDIEDETTAGEFYLDSLGVLPDYRGQGIGAALLSAMRDMAFEQGYDRVALLWMSITPMPRDCTHRSALSVWVISAS